MRGDLFYTFKTSVIDLLPATGFIEIYNLYPLGVAKVCNMRIIKCDMGIFTYSHTYNIYFILFQQLLITFTFFLYILSASIDIKNLTNRNVTKQSVIKKIGKALRMHCFQSDILIHMKSHNPAPVYSLIVAQSIQEFILRWRRGKYY